MEDMSNIIVKGIFQAEIKNRFLCDVLINGIETICYIPSSCRLSNFLDLRNREVLLVPTKTVHSRTQYAVYAIKYGRRYILVNLSLANRIIEDQLHRKYFSFLGARKKLSHEMKIGDYKADLFVHDTKTIIEIKSFLTFERMGVFPTVYSERAINQLKELSNLLDKGYHACYIFVSLNPCVKSVAINCEIEEYYRLFIDCVEKGMSYFGCSIQLCNTTPIIYSRVNVILSNMELNECVIME